MNFSRRDRDDLEALIDEEERESPGARDRIDALTELAMARHLLRTRRQALGLTQTAVARKMGVSQAAVSQLEGGADVTVTTLARYMHALGVRDWAARVVGE